MSPSSLVRVPASPHLPALATLACACLLVAHTLSAGVDAALQPPPLPGSEWARPAAPAEPLAEPKVTPLSAERLARLTGLTLVDASQPGPMPPEDDALPPAPGLKLLGTLVSARPEASFASLYVEASRRARTVWPGSVLDGAEVLSIERGHVLVRQGERLARVGFGPAAPSSPPPAPPGPLREAPHFQLELDRNGQPVRKAYTVGD